MQNDTCKLGIRYDSLPGRALDDYPCFYSNRRNAAACPKCDYPTKEEVEADERMWADHIAKTMLAAGLIDAAPAKRGILECPVCKGRLHYSVAACNGHRRAKCETEDCINFIE